MTNFIYANNVSTTLAAAATATSATLTLASATNLPTLPPGYVLPLTLNDAATRMIYEIVYVTAITGTTMTVMRAQEGTTAQNWNISDYAFSTLTAGGLLKTSNYTSLVEDTTLVMEQSGSFIEIDATSPITIMMPNPLSEYGLKFAFYNVSGMTQTLETPYGVFSGPFGSSTTTLIIPPYAVVYLETDGGNWPVTIGSMGNTAYPFNVAPAVAGTNAPQSQQLLAGYGSSYIAETTNRALGTTYTNSYGRPIFVIVWATAGAANDWLNLYVNGAQVGSTTAAFATGAITTGYLIVPVGATYEVTDGNGTLTLDGWWELN